MAVRAGLIVLTPMSDGDSEEGSVYYSQYYVVFCNADQMLDHPALKDEDFDGDRIQALKDAGYTVAEFTEGSIGIFPLPEDDEDGDDE